MKHLDEGDRARVLQGVGAQLSHEPTRPTKNRKPMRPNWLAAYRLRIAGKLRVYYDVDEAARLVTIRGIGIKVRSQLILGGKEIDLE